MSIKSRLDSAIQAFIKDQKVEPEEVLANGKIVSTDKKDVEDPGLKFAGVRHVRTRRTRTRTRNNVDFFKPEYDFPTIANAVQLDGLLRRIVNLFVEQIMKNGFEYVSKSEKAQRHIERRIKEIELLTGISLYETIEQVARQLVTYANAYIIKVRSNVKSSYGKQYRLYGKNMNPIVGLFVADSTTMEIGLNTQGNITQYKQTIRGEEIYYDERDVIHIAFNKIPGTLTGHSSLLSVLDDVRALRKLEEEIEILGFQYSIPLYLYKVGNKDIPPAPGEVDDVSSTINSMPAYGMLVVPGHHDVTVPSNNNSPVDIMAFVEHFKKRIFSGTGVSPVAMGEVATSNRNTSEALDASMQTVTKSYQQIIKHRIEIGFFYELMLDGRQNNINEEIEFNFPEIDLEQQIKYETNVIQKWQNNLIDLETARNELEYDRKIDEKRTFVNLVEMPKIKAKFQGDIQVAKAKASNSNKVAPANQHGKSSGRPKFVKDIIGSFQNDVIKLTDTLGDFSGFSDFNTITLIENCLAKFRLEAKEQLKENIFSYKRKFNIIDIETDIDDEFLNNYFCKAELILEDKIKYFSSKSDDNSNSDILYKELVDFLNSQKLKLDSLSRILIYKSLGFKSILVNADDCNEHELINLKANVLSYLQIPPFGYGCNCFIDDEKLYEFK